MTQIDQTIAVEATVREDADTELGVRIDALTSKLEYAEWLAQSALDAAAVHVQAAPVSMEDFATFRLGILGLLLERLCDEHQNPVVLSELVKRMNAYEAAGHEHDPDHVHAGDHYEGEDHDHEHDNVVVATPTTVAAVMAAPAPIAVPTIRWDKPPAMHYGGSFYVYAEFSEALSAGFRDVRDHGFDVEDGEVTSVNRVRGRSDLWRICVRPTRFADCTIISTDALIGVSGQAPHSISITVPYSG